MNFGQRLRDFRKYELDIKVNEAAYRLGVSPTAYSNYENGTRAISIDLLPIIKDKFGMSDEVFLDMLLGTNRARAHKTPQQLSTDIKELRERYNIIFNEDYFEFITSSPNLRELISMLSMLDHKKQNFMLHAIKNIVTVNMDLLKQIEKLEAKNSDEL